MSEIPESEYPAGHTKLAKLLLNASKGQLNGKRILVVGDPEGLMTRFLRKNFGADAYGISMEDRDFNKAHDMLAEGRLAKGDALFLGKYFDPGKKFDYIISEGVMSTIPLGFHSRYSRFRTISKEWDARSDLPLIGGTEIIDFALRLKGKKTISRRIEDMRGHIDDAAEKRIAPKLHEIFSRWLKRGGLAIHATEYYREHLLFDHRDAHRLGYAIEHLATDGTELVLRKVGAVQGKRPEGKRI